jgi:hypothetical protein
MLLLGSTLPNVQDITNNSNMYKSDEECVQDKGMRRREGEEIEWENLDCILLAEHSNHWRTFCADSVRENSSNFFTYVLKQVVTSEQRLRREV